MPFKIFCHGNKITFFHLPGFFPEPYVYLILLHCIGNPIYVFSEKKLRAASVLISTFMYEVC
jgi:hypothetical protein